MHWPSIKSHVHISLEIYLFFAFVCYLFYVNYKSSKIIYPFSDELTTHSISSVFLAETRQTTEAVCPNNRHLGVA